jgi:hypothetical protein
VSIVIVPNGHITNVVALLASSKQKKLDCLVYKNLPKDKALLDVDVDITAQLIFFHSRLNICGYNMYWLALL